MFSKAQPPVTNEVNNVKKQPVEEIKVETAVPVPEIQTAGAYPPHRLALAYVIWQKYAPIFNPAEALKKGTVFPELYSPYPY